MGRKIRRRSVLKAGVAGCAGTAVAGMAGAALGDSRSPEERKVELRNVFENALRHMDEEPSDE